MEELVCPVRVGDKLKVKIEALGKMGDGLTHIKGYTVFVPETYPHDRLIIQIKTITPTYALAKKISAVY